MTKKVVKWGGIAVAILYAIASLYFISSRLWNDFEMNVRKASMDAGYVTAISQLYTEVKKEECKPVSIMVPLDDKGKTATINIVEEKCKTEKK